MRIDRMLAITVMLLNRDRISAKELADKFEVSLRTIYRDIDAINMAGIPIVSYQGNNGGFGIMENYKLDRQLLTFADMTAILSALKGINRTFENNELDGAIEKIKNLVPKEREYELDLYTERIILDVLPWGYSKLEKENLKELHAAISSSRIIEFDYRNKQGETTSREVEPMTLLFKGYGWYFFAYCHLKSDFRLFKLGRIKNLYLTDKIFSRREGSYKGYEYGEEEKKLIHVVLIFHKEMHAEVEEMFPEGKIHVLPDGRLSLCCDLPSGKWLYSFLLSFGALVEVVEPAELREEIKKRVNEIIALY